MCDVINDVINYCAWNCDVEVSVHDKIVIHNQGELTSFTIFDPLAASRLTHNNWRHKLGHA